MQIKITVGYHCAATRMAQMKKFNTKCWRSVELSYVVVKYKMEN